MGIEPKTRELTAREAADVDALVMSLNFHRRHLKPHEKGAALDSYLRRKGWTGKSKGGRPSKGDGPRQVSIKQAAKELGIPRMTAVDHLRAHEDYKAAPAPLREKIDRGEITPKQAAPVATQPCAAVFGFPMASVDAILGRSAGKEPSVQGAQMAWWNWRSDTHVEIQAAFANRLFAKLVEHVERTATPGSEDLLREAKECIAGDPINAMARRMRYHRLVNYLLSVACLLALAELAWVLGLLGGVAAR